MKKSLSCFFVAMALMQGIHAQSISYNQYNAVLAEINPACIASLETDYVSLIGRWQWPGYAHSAGMGSFAISKQLAGINSSLGMSLHQTRYSGDAYLRSNIGIRYGYRVIFLEKYLLNLGAGISLQKEHFTLPVFFDGFEPGQTVNAHLLYRSEAQTIDGNYGILLLQANNKFYAGFSLRNHSLWRSRLNRLTRHPTLSAQVMQAFDLTRRLRSFVFFSYEYNRSVTDHIYSLLLRKSFSAFLIQANFLYNDRYSVGVGYKYFTGTYGSLHYRIGFTTKRKKTKLNTGKADQRVTMGLGYDIKPYILSNRINSYASYEAFLKYKIPW